MTLQELTISYEVDCIFQYLYECYINGNFSQCKRILLEEIKKCSDMDKIPFYNDNEYKDFIFNIYWNI